MKAAGALVDLVDSNLPQRFYSKDEAWRMLGAAMVVRMSDTTRSILALTQFGFSGDAMILLRTRLDSDVAVDVRFLRRRSELIEYAVVLLARECGQWRAVRVYDNSHGGHDMHRYNREGVKQAAESFYRGYASEALQSAIGAVHSGYGEMIESWRR